MTKRCFTADEDRLIAAQYEAGDSVLHIASRHGVSFTPVRSALRRQGVAIRVGTERQRQYAVDDHAFNDADQTEAGAYFVGLLFADGCVYDDGLGRTPSISIGLSGDDGRHLDALRTFVRTDKPLSVSTPREHGGFRHTMPMTRLEIISKPMADALARYGVSPRKSLTARVAPCMAGNRHFWRGVIDGDGWLQAGNDGRPNPVIGLTGSRTTAEQFVAFAVGLVGGKPVGIRPNGTVFKAEFTGSRAHTLTRHLYRQSAIALPRKLAIAFQMFELFDGRHWQTHRDWSALTETDLLQLRSDAGSWLAVSHRLGMDPAQLYRIRTRLTLAARRIRTEQ